MYRGLSFHTTLPATGKVLVRPNSMASEMANFSGDKPGKSRSHLQPGATSGIDGAKAVTAVGTVTFKTKERVTLTGVTRLSFTTKRPVGNHYKKWPLSGHLFQHIMAVVEFRMNREGLLTLPELEEYF